MKPLDNLTYVNILYIYTSETILIIYTSHLILPLSFYFLQSIINYNQNYYNRKLINSNIIFIYTLINGNINNINFDVKRMSYSNIRFLWFVFILCLFILFLYPSIRIQYREHQKSYYDIFLFSFKKCISKI